MPGFRVTLLVFSALMMASCGPTTDDQGYYQVQRYDDPFALPYRFDVLKKKHIPVGAPESTSDRYYPLDIFGDGNIGLYVIGSNWRPRDTMSCAIFYSAADQTGTLSQVNIKTAAITSHYPYDFDHDTIQEVAITYTTNDTLWLEILDVHETGIFRRALVAGVDRNGSGAWDGRGNIGAAVELTNDGHEELLISCDVDYDLYPRKLICVDWFQDSICWEFEVAGLISHEFIHAVPSADSTDATIVFGVLSKGNAARTADMDDRHSYLVCLNKDGVLQWKRETGGVFSRGNTAIFDYGADGSPDILKTYEKMNPDDSAATRLTANGLLVVDLAGRTLDSLVLPADTKFRKIQIFDVDGDGKREIYLMTTDRAVLVYDHLLRPLGKYRFAATADVVDCRDFLGRGDRQLLIGKEDGETVLLSADFDVLARFDDGPAFAVPSAYPRTDDIDGFNIILADRRGRVNYWLTLSKNPWNSIFFRNPLLAFLAAFLPMAVLVLVVGYYTIKIRRKNKIISQRGEQLAAAMQKLRDTQEKLVAAEKYKQARDIAGGFAHEIRNALFPARGTLTRLAGSDKIRTLTPEEIAEYAGLINDSIIRAVELTQLISLYTKLDAVRLPEPVNLGNLVHQVVDAKQVILVDRGIDVQIEGPPDVVVKSNSSQLYMVLDNLLLNSIDALTNRTNPAIFVMWEKDKALVRLEFSDNGYGIERENMSRVFDAFYSTKPEKGTGLGLAMAKKIIEMYGGTIAVTSAPDTGTTFAVVLESDGERSS